MTMIDPEGYYQILDIAPTSDFVTIGNRRTVQKKMDQERRTQQNMFHPDKQLSRTSGSAKPNFKEMSIRVNQAHAALKTGM